MAAQLGFVFSLSRCLGHIWLLQVTASLSPNFRNCGNSNHWDDLHKCMWLQKENWLLTWRTPAIYACKTIAAGSATEKWESSFVSCHKSMQYSPVPLGRVFHPRGGKYSSILKVYTWSSIANRAVGSAESIQKKNRKPFPTDGQYPDPLPRPT